MTTAWKKESRIRIQHHQKPSEHVSEPKGIFSNFPRNRIFILFEGQLDEQKKEDVLAELEFSKMSQPSLIQENF